MIIYICDHVIFEYKITRRSHANTSFPIIYKHSVGAIIGMYLKMTNVLFGVEKNVSRFKGITLTNKALLFSCDTCININSLPLVTIFFGPHSMLNRIEYCSIVI